MSIYIHIHTCDEKTKKDFKVKIYIVDNRYLTTKAWKSYDLIIENNEKKTNDERFIT